MDRRLIIMRHAKSAWDTDAPTDHARPLNKRGRRDAPRIGQRLAELQWQPQLVLSSDSQRTQETFRLLCEGLGQEIQVRFLLSLYAAGTEELTTELRAVDDDVACVLALGHNPGWEEAVEWLCEQSVHMTTANAVLLEGSGSSWGDTLSNAGLWNLRNVIRPKEL
jgi:phosphohistidine phosphatase